MELPVALRQAVDRLLDKVPLGVLKDAGRTLSDRYRAEIRDGRLHMAGDAAVKAYLTTRLPATYAAVRASLATLAEIRQDFAPSSLLDIGAGPGTVLWATLDSWPGLETATLVEASEPARRAGETLLELARGQDSAHAPTVAWLSGDATLGLAGLDPAALVTAAYVLDELAPPSIAKLVDRLWALTGDTLLVVEPGTPAGWRRILDVRAQLIGAGGHVLAPCPHQAPCPLAAPDWCHFSRRVARSRLHRLAKGAAVPWEDEKFIYLAVSRRPPESPLARVLAPPRTGSGKVALKLCLPDGRVEDALFTKRDGDLFRRARRADWGDGFNP